MTVGITEDIAPGRTRPSHNMKRTRSKTSVHLENMESTPQECKVPDDGIWENESPQNPHNWPRWKKNAQILMVAFHSMMGTSMAAGIIPAYDTFAEQYNVTVPDASYLTSCQVCVLSVELLILLWQLAHRTINII